MTANRMSAFLRSLSIFSAGILLLIVWSAAAYALAFPGEDKIINHAVVDKLAQGGAEDIIVLLDESGAVRTAAALRAQSGKSFDTEEIVRAKASAYRILKDGFFSAFSTEEVTTLKDYSHLPVMFVSVKNLASLKKLAADNRVKGIYKNRVLRPFLAESLPLIGQPAAQAAGFVGTGTAVAVLDSGADYRGDQYGDGTAFGTCSGINTPGDCLSLPAVPSGCKVACSHDFTATDDGSLDNDGHGTNVAGIVMGVAPDTRIVALDIFTGSGNSISAWSSDILAAINWVIAHKSTYNIVAINMSLGGGEHYTTPCTNDEFAVPVAEAKSAGILSTVASGNDGYYNAISSPACVPAAVSVGAVYDSSDPSIGWACPSDVPAPDLVTCFSNSAYYLTFLAPGCEILSAHMSEAMCGTSQASPHAAGAIAVMKGSNAYPSDTPDETISRLASIAAPVTDPSNGIVTPRINLAFTVSHTISGTITKPSGQPLAGVTVSLSGPDTANTVTDASGKYSFGSLAGGTYTVQPSSPSVTFNPTARTVAAPASGVNFTAMIYSLSGTVRTSKGTAVSGVTVILSGGPSAGSTVTDSAGNYSFADLFAGNYLVTPAKSGYAISPSSASVTLNANVTSLNFTVPTYKIAGHVYATAANAPLSSVTVALAGDASRSVVSAADGSFAFDDLKDGSYTVTPARSGYSFAPLTRVAIVNGADLNDVNFVRAFTISGHVRAKKGSLVFPGVAVTLSGLSSAETMTDSAGYYQFAGLIPGSYNVTPNKMSLVFSPAGKSVSLKSKNVIVDFKVNTYSISGTVKTALGIAMSGVSLTVNGCDISATSLTDSKGKFVISNLPNCSYTVSPSDPAGHIFTPGSASVIVTNAKVTGIAFSGP